MTCSCHENMDQFNKNTLIYMHEQSSEVCSKTRAPPDSLLLKGKVSEHTTVNLMDDKECRE